MRNTEKQREQAKKDKKRRTAKNKRVQQTSLERGFFKKSSVSNELRMGNFLKNDSY